VSKKKKSPVQKLIEVMAALRSPEGCPWDREQDHLTLRFHAVEEVYELMDAIEAGDDHEMKEELGDLLLQVVFHCQLAGERKAFDFDDVASNITEKLIRRHPHVFGDKKVKDVEAVWEQWEKIKKQEKAGTRQDRKSALDGIPKHLPGLMRAEKLFKKAAKAGLIEKPSPAKAGKKATRKQLGEELVALSRKIQQLGYSPEELLRSELQKEEKKLRAAEKTRNKHSSQE